MTRPSSGVKPIVVSTLTAAADGGQRRPGAQVAGDDPQPLEVLAEQLGGAARGVLRATGRGIRTGAGRTARSRRRAGRSAAAAAGSVGVERGVEAGDGGHVRAAAARPASMPASARGWCSGARSVRPAIAARTASSITVGPGEPAAAVHDPVADGVDPVLAAQELARARRGRAAVPGVEVQRGGDVVRRRRAR